MEQLKYECQVDQQAIELIRRLQADPKAVPNFTIDQNLILYKGRLWVGPNSPLRSQILFEEHNGPCGGH